MRPVVPILSLRLLARKVPSLPSFWFVNAAVLPTVFGSMGSPVRTTLPLKSTVKDRVHLCPEPCETVLVVPDVTVTGCRRLRICGQVRLMKLNSALVPLTSTRPWKDPGAKERSDHGVVRDVKRCCRSVEADTHVPAGFYYQLRAVACAQLKVVIRHR